MKRIIPMLVFVFIVIAFFWKVLFGGLVPFPGDLLIGAYYPWYEYKFGFAVGVPIKNPLISDIFSQMYVWKHLIISSITSCQWPLWNPYVYSGYPLLANFSSGALYPLNLLLFFGVNGWSLMVILQVLGAGIAMFLFLYFKKFSWIASFGGAIAYAFSSVMMIRLEWNSAGHVMWWLAASMAIIELYFERSRKSIILLPPAIFFLITAGHFQTMFYSFILIGGYIIYKLFLSADRKRLYEISGFLILGILMASVQLLPTFVMMQKSVRFAEGAIAGDNYGLLPLHNLITMFAPDFFGNPATFNYWGFLNYSETIFYPGILGVVVLLWAGINFKKLKSSSKLFLVAAIVSIFMAFDNPIGRLVYEFKIPFLSTGYAARIAVILIFASSVLVADWLNRVSKMKIKEALLPVCVLVITLAISLGVFKSTQGITSQQMEIIVRNIIWPTILLISLSGLILFRKIKWVTIFLVLIIIVDLFRFGWKYNPNVDKKWVYPETEVINYLVNQPGLFRVETQNGPILPANTWAMYGLYSASGYDPLANKNYVSEYSRRLNGYVGASRYSILNQYNSNDLGEYNVKYLLTEKENLKVSSSLDKGWKKVMETGKLITYQNLNFKDRVEWIGDGKGSVQVEKYEANEIKLSYNSTVKGEIIIRDSWDDGWKAKVNGNAQKISQFDNVFRKIAVPAGVGVVEMKYDPAEWELGKNLADVGFLSWMIISYLLIKNIWIFVSKDH